MNPESNKNEVLVSIVTVCRNSKAELETTIESILSQTYPNIQYIIIDGNSSDGTAEMVQKYKDGISVFISEKDKGIYDAMNKGISHCNGEIIGLLNAGDTYEPAAIAHVVAVYEANNKKEGVYYGGFNKTKNGAVMQTFLSENCNVPNIVKMMSLYHTATFISKSLYQDLGVYDSSFKISGDFELLRRFYLKQASFIDIDFVTTNMAGGGISDQFRSIKVFSAESSRIKANGKKNLDYYFDYLYTASIAYLSFLKRRLIGNI